MARPIFAALMLALGSSAAAWAAPLPFVPQPPSRAARLSSKPQQAAADAQARAEAASDPTLRDAVSDEKSLGRIYVSQAVGRLAAGDPAGAIELSARALTVDPSDESAFATLKLAESQLRAAGGAEAAALAYRDAVAGRAMSAAQGPRLGAYRELPGSAASRGFWRLVFSPVIGILLLAAGAAHVGLGRLRRRTLTTLRSTGPAPFFASAPAADPALPILPGDYRCVSILGEGGMGVVYAAEDGRLGRKVAIKKMRDEIKRNAKEREHFLQEARMVACLHHPTIVDIHTILESGEDLFLVFEFVEGKTVERMLSDRRVLALDEIKNIMRGVCEALEYAHSHGVVHRDLKPSNIMVTGEGKVKVMDFGVARRAKDQLLRFTLTQTIAGTPLYMAPEAEDGIIRREADVYALGACLYEMLTGEHPFPSPASRAAKLCMRYIPPSRQREGIPAAIDLLVDWALQPDPDRRISSPREFLERLEEIG